MKVGSHHTKETKARISTVCLATDRNHKPDCNCIACKPRKHLPEEHRKKIGAANKGRKLTEEQKENLRGRVVSKESRLKMSCAKIGKKRTKPHKDGCMCACCKAKRGESYCKGKTFEELYGKERACELKKDMSDRQKGKTLSKDARKRISIANTNRIISDETRKKQSDVRIGTKLSDVTKSKLSNLMKERYKNGWINPTLGTHPSEEALEKQKLAWEKKRLDGYVCPNKGKTLEEIVGKDEAKKLKEKRSVLYMGENNPNWQGGIAFLPYSSGFNRKAKHEIAIRDNYVYQICKEERNGGKYDTHHIDYDRQNDSSLNLIFLCVPCHGMTNGNRKIWQETLEEYQQIRFGDKE